MDSFNNNLKKYVKTIMLQVQNCLGHLPVPSSSVYTCLGFLITEMRLNDRALLRNSRVSVRQESRKPLALTECL